MTAEQWLAAHCRENKIALEKLTAGERFQLARQVPCQIRCARIGESVDVKPGEKCPECGKSRLLLTIWERLDLEGIGA